MDATEIIKKLINNDSQEIDRIRKSAPDRMSPDRAHRFVQLYNRVDALTDVLGMMERIKRGRATQEALVVVAGPNPPEVLTLGEIAEILPDFDVSECWFYTRREDGGGLEVVDASTVDSVRDESFIYFTTRFKIPGVHGRTIGTCSWSKRRPS